MKLNNLVLMASALAAAATHAAIFDVTTTADTGVGSLRTQIAAAASGDTVTISATGTIILTTGEILTTGKDLTLTGPGANNLTITTNSTTRALKFINSQSSVSGITFINCKALPGDIDTGGAIAVDNFTAGGGAKVTTISDCAFTNNQSGWGGAVDIFNGGLVMNRCTFSGNTCTGLAFGTTGGGGALCLGPTVASTVTNCTFSSNTQTGAATGQPGGGAIYNYGSNYANPPVVNVVHCTFFGNVDAAAAAGAIKGNYTASYHTVANLKNCLLTGNQAPVSVLRNFSGNPTGSLTASYASLGGNVTDETTTSAQFMVSASDAVSNTTLATSVSPTLASNGGVTKTHAFTRGSPAQRRGATSTALTDQRGAPRHPVADAGAFELIEPEIRITETNVPVPENGQLDFGTTPFDTPIVKTVTVTNTQTSAFTSGPLLLANASTPAGFSLSGFPATALANGESATFTVTLGSAIPGLFNVPLTFTGNDAFNPSLATTGTGSPNAHAIGLAALVTDTITHWRAQNFGADAGGILAADDANPAGDGIANLLKYSLGLDPHVPCTTKAAITTTPDPAGFLKMTVTKNPAATDVDLAVEVTGDLNSPNSWNSDGTTVDLNTPTTLQAHDNTPMSAASARFMRLRATRP